MERRPMANIYRVVDLRGDLAERPETTIDGVSSPEAAARKALGIDLVRSGSVRDLVARVYWQLGPDAINMVRLYSRVVSTRRR